MFAEVTILGRVGRVPQLRHTKAGDAVCSFSVAVNERKDDTKWWTVTAYGKNAESACRHVRAGMTVLVAGRPGLDSWTGKDGKDHVSMSVHANAVKFVFNRRDGESDDADPPKGEPLPPIAEDDIPF